MPNIPSAVPPTIIANKIHPVSSSPLDIDNLKPGSKYFYQKFNNLGIIDNYVGIFIKQKPDKNYENRPIYFFREVYYIGNGGKFFHGEKHYPSGQYPFNFIEIVTSTTPVNRVSPPPSPRGGGKIRKSKNRKTKNYRRRGTRKH